MDPAAAVTPLGQLPFLIEFLKVSGLFDAWVADCPLTYQSNNGSGKRAILATFLLSILAGHHPYRNRTIDSTIPILQAHFQRIWI